MKVSSKIVFALFLLIILTCCKLNNKKDTPSWNALPEVTDLVSLKQTDFVPTLENPITGNKNIVYAPTLLYAWDKLEEELKTDIAFSTANSLDFRLLTQSASHQNSLLNSEYTVSSEIKDEEISVKAFFNKTLPFQIKLQVADTPMIFGNTKVAAFGMYHYDEAIIKNTEILFYKDDSDFILRLIPKDYQHEIILVRGIVDYPTLGDALKQSEQKIELGKNEKNDVAQLWKYNIAMNDCFSIPCIQLNIQTNYKKIEGQSFYTKSKRPYSVEEAYQRTGFILNEDGAAVESEAIIKVKKDTVSVMEQGPHPKKMLFDKEFLVIVKHVDRANPYFVMKVNNAELLKKQ